jgi:hypothetical protein
VSVVSERAISVAVPVLPLKRQKEIEKPRAKLASLSYLVPLCLREQIVQAATLDGE